MINLAGNKDADKHIYEELYLAGIEAIKENSRGEVPYTVIGRIGNWRLRRAWYYWIASAERREDGLPLDIAMKLHNTKHPTKEIMGNTIRSGGHCGCPSPVEFGAEPVYDEAFKLELKLIREDPETITNGRVSELCHLKIITAPRYVDCYHIDDQIGLCEFGKIIKSL